MVERYATWLIRWRWAVVMLTLVWVVAAAMGGRLLSFSNDYRIFFSADNPQLLAFDALQNDYTKSDNLLFVLTSKEGDLFTPEALSIVEELTDAAWQTPYSSRVDSLTNFQNTYASDDDLVVEPLVKHALSLSPEDATRIKAIAMDEPVLMNRLITAAGHVTGINVTLHLPGKNPQTEAPEVVAFARQLAAQFEKKYPAMEIRLTGDVMMNNAFPEAGTSDVKTLVPLMFMVVILLIGITMKMVTGTLVTMTVIALTIVSALGLTGWVGIPISPPTTSAPVVMMVIVVANCVHLLNNFQQHYHLEGDKAAAMVQSLRLNMMPIFVTNITTIMGFLSMNFSDSPPLRDLGNIVVMGVMTGYLLSVTLLPAMLMLVPVKRPVAMARSSGVMAALAEFVIRRRTPVFYGSVFVVVVLAAFIPNNELNDEFVKYFDKSIKFRADTDYTTANLTGIYRISYSLDSGESNGISRPDYLNTIEAFGQWYRGQPEVIHVQSFADVMKRLSKNLHNDNPEWYRIPERRDLAAQYLLLYEMSLPYGLDLNNQLNVDKSATRFDVTVHSLSSKQLMALEVRAQQWLKANAPAAMLSDGSSPAIMFAHIGQRNIESMLKGSVIALALISLTLIVSLRSFKVGLISLVPNLVPATVAFGIWGIFVGQVGLSLSVVVGMTLGIIVDDTVHFLSKYLRARREQGLSSEDAVRYAFANVGNAMWVTSVALVSGFLMLSLSAFELNSGMGLLTAITIVVALLADFLLLPALLLKFEESRNERKGVSVS